MILLLRKIIKNIVSKNVLYISYLLYFFFKKVIIIYLDNNLRFKYKWE